MDRVSFSKVEQSFVKNAGVQEMSTRIPYVTVDNFPKLGMLTALRFLEWVSENPDGVISLPTGKTPEFFIRWTQYLLSNWDNKKGEELRSKHGLDKVQKPDLRGLHFVQIDEFYPIASSQHNSFYHYVNEYYLKGFQLDRKKALLINSDEIPLAEGKKFQEIFPGNLVDLSLRYRDCSSSFEQLQQRSIFLIDDWCSNYEEQIRLKGGIGFFLGGIGPDGHIAFNTRGSDHHSVTRLTATNFETQAVAAGDLGGIELSRNRLVITIGLETITSNRNATALIFAAGEAKARVVYDALESAACNLYPASVLHKLPNARFYLTEGAASLLTDTVNRYYREGPWTQEKSERAVIDLCRNINKFGNRVLPEDLKNDPYCSLIPDINEQTVNSVIDSITQKMEKGLIRHENQVFLHTGPHHDDIMLGLLPQVSRQMRVTSNKSSFVVLTSGFTAVTNQFIREVLMETRQFLDKDLIQMVNYPDFFEQGFRYKWDKDVYHYLNKVAAGEASERRRGLCHRVVRAIVELYQIKTRDELRDKINEVLAVLGNSYDGEKNPPKIQRLKGMIREFEEELVWAHFGVRVKDVKHLRLGFYTGDIFTEQPNKTRDVTPILQLLRETKPTVISLAFDPEGSGPDTHYKVLQAIAEAIREWGKEQDISKLRVWGYRNVWFRFMPSEADVIVPVSLNALALLDKSFNHCYLSQVDASFPSYQLDGKFSSLAQKIWVQQLNELQFLLGKDFFYQHENPVVRSSHGLLFYRDMSVEEFLNQARELEKTMEGFEL